MAETTSSTLTTKELFTALVKEPDRDDLHKQLEARVLDPKRRVEISNAAQEIWSTLTTIPGAIGSGVGSIIGDVGRRLGLNLSWVNCIKQQECKPSKILRPTGLQDLIGAVEEAKKSNLSLRAVGSGHSFSSVAPPYDGGILLNPSGMNKVLNVNTDFLRDPTQAKTLFSVESGITIRDLNKALDDHKLALLNMGAYDGQTIAGAISTGTHGTGISLGPIASSVRALILVSEKGTVYQIEPSDGISDPAKFKAGNSSILLKQDDDWFNSTVIAMGCMGLIYSYILEVTPAYLLKEERSLSTWEDVKQDLVFTPGGGLPAVLTQNRHFEVDINPYVVQHKHSCVVQKKNIDKGPAHGSRGVADWFASLLAGYPAVETWLVDALNKIPRLSPTIINSALSTLVDRDYIDKSFKILNIGAVDNLQALAMEISLPADETLITSIDNLLATFAGFANDKTKRWYLAGPIALRFVAASPAYLAPQQGRVTCMVELDMLVGITTGVELLKAVVEAAKKENQKARIHWGLDLDTVTGQEFRERYEKYSKWLDVYHTLNSTGTFNNRFTDRLEISVGGKPKA